MHVNCQRCNQEMDCTRFPPGSSVKCVRCQTPFVVPYAGLVEVDEPEQLPVINVRGRSSFEGGSPVYISTGSRPLSRLKPTGWFGNAFGATLGIVLALLVVPVLGCGGLIILGGIANSVTPVATPARNTATAQPPSKVTAENFARIRVGMNGDQVRKILGDPNEILSEIEIGDTRAVTFGWNSPGISHCQVTFSDGQVASKVQFGLK